MSDSPVAGSHRPERSGGRRGALSRLISGIRRVAGMPDYAAHVEHLRHCHPDRPVPSQREFFEEYLRARYGEGPTRCC